MTSLYSDVLQLKSFALSLRSYRPTSLPIQQENHK